MPRIPRKNFQTNFYHIMVQGINKEFIFKNSTYIEKYLSIISKYLNDFPITILAYCIMNNHAHFLIFSENVNSLSNFMQRVNTSYARFYNKQNNRVGYVFRDRYNSQPIYNHSQLYNCIKYIHNNPVKANIVNHMCEYQYSSYNEFLRKRSLLNEKSLLMIFGTSKTDLEQFKLIHENNENEYFIDIPTNEVNIDDFISQIQLKLGITIEDIIKDKELLKKILVDSRTQTNATLEELALTFDLSISTIYRYCNTKKR